MLDTLYYKDNYLKEFKTKVINCIEENEKIKVVLQETAFYPEGGGQNADTGWIDEARVLDVKEKDGVIYHTVDAKLEVGKQVICKIYFEQRYSNMQHHTAEHIVSGLICNKYDTQNVGFHMGKDAVTMDFNVVLNKEQIEEIEQMANEAVFKNLPIKVTNYTKEQAKKLEYRSKKDLEGTIRIVEIPGYDICACCGLHVARTGEIGMIKLLSVQKYKAGCRISLLCGKRALENYNDIYKQIDATTTLLSIQFDEVADSVKELVEKNKELKHQNMLLKEEMFELEIKSMQEKRNQFIIKENLNPNEIRLLCNKLQEKASNIAGVFSKEGNIYRFQIISKESDLKEISKELINKYDGKGGGNANSIQGQFNITEKQVKEIIDLLKKV